MNMSAVGLGLLVVAALNLFVVPRRLLPTARRVLHVVRATHGATLPRLRTRGAEQFSAAA
jgi:hypothetical protein